MTNLKLVFWVFFIFQCPAELLLNPQYHQLHPHSHGVRVGLAGLLVRQWLCHPLDGIRTRLRFLISECRSLKYFFEFRRPNIFFFISTVVVVQVEGCLCAEREEPLDHGDPGDGPRRESRSEHFMNEQNFLGIIFKFSQISSKVHQKNELHDGLLICEMNNSIKCPACNKAKFVLLKSSQS